MKEKDMHEIRNYRNAIHSFKDRPVGTWEELNEYLKLIIRLMVDMITRLSDLPDEVLPIPEFYSEEKTKLIMQEKEWFDYKLGLSI